MVKLPKEKLLYKDSEGNLYDICDTKTLEKQIKKNQDLRTQLALTVEALKRIKFLTRRAIPHSANDKIQNIVDKALNQINFKSIGDNNK